MHEIFKQNYVLTGNKNREQQSCNVTVNFKQRTDVRVARNHFDFVFQLSQRTTEYVRVWPPPNFLSPYILRVTPTLSHENNGSHLRLKFWNLGTFQWNLGTFQYSHNICTSCEPDCLRAFT